MDTNHLNHVIARVLRRYQLARGYRREMLKNAIRSLNAARRYAKDPYGHNAAQWSVESALQWVRISNNAALCAVMDMPS